VALAAIAVQLVSRTDPTSGVGEQSYVSTLKPPFLRGKAPASLDAFLDDADRMKAGLDKARVAPTTGRGWFDSDDEE
jgi:hypothetical protein